MSTPIKDRGVFATEERWKELRTDPAFVEIVRIARVANSLSLAWGPLLAPLEDQSPKARRERFAALFYSAAILNEGLKVAQGLGKHFRHLPQYKGFAALAGDPLVRALNGSFLDHIRNEHVFHFDRESLAAGLKEFPQEEEVLIATASDFQQGEIYFDLADDALLGALLGDSATVEEYVARLRQLMLDVTMLFARFMKAAHSLIPAALKQMGCRMKDVDRPLPPPPDET